MIMNEWNARSLIANGQQLKGFIENLKKKPEILCVQETWLRPSLDLSLKAMIVSAEIEGRAVEEDG